jgi:hypothetical protein
MRDWRWRRRGGLPRRENGRRQGENQSLTREDGTRRNGPIDRTMAIRRGRIASLHMICAVTIA